MVDKNLIATLSVEDAEAELMIADALGQAVADGDMEGLLADTIGDFKPNSILTGKITGHAGDDFLVDVGLKSEGILDKTEFDDHHAVEIGDTVEVLLEDVDGDGGTIAVSKRKADRIRGWEKIISHTNEGDEVSGKCMRKIKGGLLVDIGYPVFLPASQVDIRRPHDIGIYIGQTVEASVLKIDTERRNIVISRRKLIEERRARLREDLLTKIKVGDVVEGTVKNIADFGAFVDLGGIDGLLHITDMSWGRVNHPSDMVKIEQKLEVKILNIDYDREKIALGLKQKDTSPWEDIEKKYPV
ncbi:MAG: S1 RNA-binding domain-containing protein, partial [Planctomycetota bacterium]